MKICIFTHTFPRFSGDTAAPFMGSFAESLARAGHEVIVLVPYDKKLNLGQNRIYKIKSYRYIFPDSLHLLGYSRTLTGDKSLKIQTYFLSPFLFFFGLLALLKVVKEEKIDVVSSHWIIPNGFIAALAYKISGVPFTTAIPGSDIYLGGKNRLFKWMVGFAANNARFVLSDSSHYLKQLEDLGFKSKRKKVIRYGVNTKKFRPLAKDNRILEELGLTTATSIILAVGRLVRKKGFLYLIRAMPDVLDLVPGVKLVIVGDGDQKEELLAEVRKLGLEESIIFAGIVSYDELSKYYNIGDVFVMPSIRDDEGNIDASPVAMMEAMACGTPVIATRFSGSGDLIEAGKTGFLVKERDSRGITQSIIALLKNKSPANRRAVRKVAEKNFSTVSVAKRYIQIFRLALSLK